MQASAYFGLSTENSDRVSRQNQEVAAYVKVSCGERSSLISPENGLSSFPVLRVCRRRRAGNSNDSTQLTTKYRDTPSGLHTLWSKHAIGKGRLKCRVKHYSLLKSLEVVVGRVVTLCYVAKGSGKVGTLLATGNE